MQIRSAAKTTLTGFLGGAYIPALDERGFTHRTGNSVFNGLHIVGILMRSVSAA
jgi:hypothetical protein